MPTEVVRRKPESLNDLAADASQNAILRAFGAPSHELLSDLLSKKSALVALHLAATFYKIAIVTEVLDYHSSSMGFPVEHFPVLSLLIAALEGKNARSQAAILYQHAIDCAPELAEAYYGRARLSQAASDVESALTDFETVLQLSPHLDAPAYALLHANAHWERATILEQQGRDEAALRAYRAAITGLETFGVDHIRLARFLRRLGCFEEAAVHYRRCMIYTHRYFPEFILPPLATSAPSPPLSVEVIYNTQRGEPIIYWKGTYLALNAHEGPFDFTNIEQFERRLTGGLAHRSATSIAALEDVTL
jgi:tetratricopeptide (TPR) repeat protein